MKVCLLALPIMCLGLGCQASYNVAVNGYSTTGQAVQIPEGSPISVVIDSNAPNPILEKEVAEKIRRLLANRGYGADEDKAEYYLLFDYGIDPGQTVIDTIPFYHPGRYDEHLFSPFNRRGDATYMPYSSMSYMRWLVLKLIDGETYNLSQDVRPSSVEAKAEPLWICEVASAGMSSDLRDVINYMLIAAFEHLGQDTRRQVTEVI
ncbi:MAG: hypothetical protein ACYSW0_19535, partial [Planctomycetota bacterium]